MKINYRKEKYYYTEMIFYGNEIEDQIKLEALNYDNFGLKKRIRLLLYNTSKNEIINIINKNSNNEKLNKKASNILNNNNQKKILINFFINNNLTNLLLFVGEEKKLIVSNNKEREFFIQFYHKFFSVFNSPQLDEINSICADYKDKLDKFDTLFRQKINSLNENDFCKIYLSFINQGFNCLKNNNIITKNDLQFILGYMILYVYIFNYSINSSFIFALIENIKKMIKENYNEFDQIKIIISFTMFYLNKIPINNLLFKNKLKKEDSFLNGIEFYKRIILDLNENSDLILIYLQLNSGAGLELLNHQTCYKISMLSIENIKNHLINDIPQYFFTFNSNRSDFATSDSRTQIIAFNQYKLKNNNNQDDKAKKNTSMNITITILHESGHKKYHNNDEVGSNRSPKLFVNRHFEIIEQEHWTDKKRGESGRCLDYYLYDSNSKYPAIELISSSRSNELMVKDYFIGDLDNLNNAAREIIAENTEKKDLNQQKSIHLPKNINSISNLSIDDNNNEEEKKQLELLNYTCTDMSF